MTVAASVCIVVCRWRKFAPMAFSSPEYDRTEYLMEHNCSKGISFGDSDHEAIIVCCQLTVTVEKHNDFRSHQT
jgi:hypothetical protein